MNRKRYCPVCGRRDLTPSSITVGSDRTSRTTRVMYASISSVKSNSSWITTWYNGDTVTVDVARTTSTNSRTGSVTVTLTNGKTLTVSVKQYGMIRVNYEGSPVSSLTMQGIYSLDLPNATIDRKVTVESELAITVTNSYSWIKTSVVGKNVYISLTPNFNTSERRGAFGISNGYSSMTIQIIQKEFIPNPSYYSKDWSNYFGYYNWEQNIKNSSYLPVVKSAYKDLMKVDVSNYITGTPLSNGNILYSFDNNTETKLKAAIVTLVNATAKIYGVQAPTVVMIWDNPSLCGQYVRTNNTIEINRFMAGDKVELVKTVFHEMRHKWQDVNKATNKTLVQYLLYYNFLPGKYIKSGSNYELQVIERDAFYVEERMYQIVK